MTRAPSPRELVATLIACVESDEDSGQELQQLLAEHLSELAASLHKPPQTLLAACTMAPAARCARIHTFVKLAKKRNHALYAKVMAARSITATEQLATTARWQEGQITLDTNVVLGSDLFADRSRKYIRFDVEERGSVAISRDKLSAARRALRFSDVSCWLEAAGLRFGWRGGKGGLLLRSRPIPEDALDTVLSVVIGRPRPAVVLTRIEHQVPMLPSHRRAPFPLGDVFGLI